MSLYTKDDILDFISADIAMFEHLSRHHFLKNDREISKHKFDALQSLADEIKKTLR